MSAKHHQFVTSGQKLMNSYGLISAGNGDHNEPSESERSASLSPSFQGLE